MSGPPHRAHLEIGVVHGPATGGDPVADSLGVAPANGAGFGDLHSDRLDFALRNGVLQDAEPVTTQGICAVSDEPVDRRVGVEDVGAVADQLRGQGFGIAALPELLADGVELPL